MGFRYLWAYGLYINHGSYHELPPSRTVECQVEGDLPATSNPPKQIEGENPARISGKLHEIFVQSFWGFPYLASQSAKQWPMIPRGSTEGFSSK